MHVTRRRAVALSLVAVAALLAGVVVSLPARAWSSPGPAPVDEEVLRSSGRISALVHVRPQASLSEGLFAARAASLETGTVYEPIEVFVAYGSAAEFEKVAAHAAIEYVEANSKIELHTESSHVATRGQSLLDGEITMPDGTLIDGSGVGVAVVDSGIDGTHPDLASRMGGNVEIVCTSPQTHTVTGVEGIGFSECRTPKAAVPMDDTDHISAGGHGTHVAGIVAGTGGASGGRYHGAAPGATLYGVSIGSLTFVEAALDGLAWVLANHDQVSPAIKVVNASWGAPSYYRYREGDPTYSATWKMQEALVAEGVTLVWSAGNSEGDGTKPTTTAHCINPTPGIVCVANYDDGGTGSRAGEISSTSSRGKTDLPESWPDVSAPGEDIVSTCRATLPVCHLGFSPVVDPPNLYASLSGTSMAAPHVAGIVAQLYQVDPTLTPAEVENVIEDTAYKFQWGSPYGLHVDATNPDDTSSFDKGHGLVDAVAAVESLTGVPPSPDPTPPPTPTPPPSSWTRYYFHGDTGFGEADALTGGSTFDTVVPSGEGFADSRDVPQLTGGAPVPIDPHWTGVIDERISSLSLDVWVDLPIADSLGDVQLRASLWVPGQGAIRFPVLTEEFEPGFGRGLVHVEHTFTTMLDASGGEVPLSVDPAGQPVTISLYGVRPYNETGMSIVYDSVEYPSGFFVD